MKIVAVSQKFIKILKLERKTMLNNADTQITKREVHLAALHI